MAFPFPNTCAQREIRAAIHVIGICSGMPRAFEVLRAARKALTEEGLLQV